MKLDKKKIIFSLLFFLSYFYINTCIAIDHTPAAFGFFCENADHKWHLQPISFYEFDINGNQRANLNRDFTIDLVKLAPIKFKNYAEAIKLISKKSRDNIDFPNDDEVDSILSYPAGCRPIRLITLNYSLPNFSQVEINSKFWGLLSPELKNYYLFELFIQKYIRKDLSPVDRRRFAFYIASEQYKKFSTEELIYFLKYHGIAELNYSGISLDLLKTINFYPESSHAKDAFPVEGAIYLETSLSTNKLVSFYDNRTIKALSTMEPFSKNINGQNFRFYIDPELPRVDIPEDDRLDSRIHFYKNGMIDKSLVMPFDHLFDLVTDIKTRGFGLKDYFEIYFYDNGSPMFLSSNEGSIKLFNKTYRVLMVQWYSNQMVKETTFANPQEFTLKDGKKIKALWISIGPTGEITGHF